MKLKLKKEIVFRAGTVFECIDGEKREYGEGNYSLLFGLTNNTSGEIIYGIDEMDKDISEWFEVIDQPPEE